jgi:superfamily II DNA or RNA helicase
MITIKIDNRIHLSPVDEIPKETLYRIKERLTFDNPQFIENEHRGFSNWNTPREIFGYRIEANTLIAPRGFTGSLISILEKNDVDYKLQDCRRLLEPIDFQFQGELHKFQQDALETILKKDFGTLSAPTGSGKTIMALAAIADRRQPALIIVHSRELLEQWAVSINTFLDVPIKEIGVIGGGQFRIGKKITIALVQSLYKCASDVAPHIGHLIVDEVHRCPSRTFLEAVTAFDSFYTLGLSATPWRRDKLTRLIYWYVGNTVCEIDQNALIDSGYILKADVVTRETDFFTRLNPSAEYSAILTELSADFARNCQIINDVTREANNGSGICLILTDRKSHVETLAAMVIDRGINAEILTGDLSNKDRRTVVERLNAGRIKVLVATGQLIGEGFDARELSTLFLAMPVKFDGRLIQYLGRVMRPAPGKTMAKVYDYIDVNIGVLANSARGRQRIYSRKVEAA